MAPTAANFALIRYVPDLAKGERINIGLVWRYGDESGMRLRDDWDKVKAFDPQASIDLLRASADFILSVVASRNQLDESVVKEFSSAVQLSPVTTLSLVDASVK